MITPRNAARDAWNKAALTKHCQITGNRKYIVDAEDYLANSGETLNNKTRKAVASLSDDATKPLKHEVEIAIGMKAMVVLNISIEADVANGTRGTVTGITLDPRERNIQPKRDGHVHLRFPPAVIYFKPDRQTNITFEGITPGVIPLLPSQIRFNVEVDGKRTRIERRQIAIIAGYAFTDYKGQGQTIDYLLVDIAKPATGKLSPFSVYVALSRSKGRNNIRILRDFDESIFMFHPSEDLRTEMIRLEALDQQTKRRF